MADWFETRFREPVDAERVDPAFAARIRALVVEEWQADVGQAPPKDTEADDHEGDIIMLKTDDRPTGNEPPFRNRRPPGQWLMVAAAVAIVAVVGAVLVANSGDDEDTIDTATSVPTPPTTAQDILSLPNLVPIEPGMYSVDPDLDAATPLRVEYQVTGEGWESWAGAAKRNPNGHILLTITTVTNVVRDGCLDHSPLDPPVGPTVDDLATALTQLPPFEVTAAPSDVTMLGYTGKHLQLTVPNLPFTGTADDRLFSECQDDSLHSYFFPTPGDSFYGYNGEPGRTEDFWILDVNGTRLVIVKNTAPETPAQDLTELDAMFKSIQIQP
jgi:hypothetical protein